MSEATLKKMFSQTKASRSRGHHPGLTDSRATRKMFLNVGTVERMSQRRQDLVCLAVDKRVEQHQ